MSIACTVGTRALHLRDGGCRRTSARWTRPTVSDERRAGSTPSAPQAGRSSRVAGRACDRHRTVRSSCGWLPPDSARGHAASRETRIGVVAVTSELLTIDDVYAARERIAGRLHRTPTLGSRTLSERVGAQVHFKAELFQRTGSFKPRAFSSSLSVESLLRTPRGLNEPVR